MNASSITTSTTIGVLLLELLGPSHVTSDEAISELKFISSIIHMITFTTRNLSFQHAISWERVRGDTKHFSLLSVILFPSQLRDFVEPLRMSHLDFNPEVQLAQHPFLKALSTPDIWAIVQGVLSRNVRPFILLSSQFAPFTII